MTCQESTEVDAKITAVRHARFSLLPVSVAAAYAHTTGSPPWPHTALAATLL